MAGRGGWFEQAPNSSATRLEFDKALVNLSCNLLGQLAAIDSQGRFQALTVGEIIDYSEAEIRELAYQVFRVGQMLKVYGLKEDFEVILDQLMETRLRHADHIPSSLQWVDTKLRLGDARSQDDAHRSLVNRTTDSLR